MQELPLFSIVAIDGCVLDSLFQVFLSTGELASLSLIFGNLQFC